jgi:hypothetical protein
MRKHSAVLSVFLALNPMILTNLQNLLKAIHYFIIMLLLPKLQAPRNTFYQNDKNYKSKKVITVV